MKRVDLLIPICLVTSSFCMPGKKLLKTFMIGRYAYNIYEENYYVHDDNVDGAFYVVYRANHKPSICSAWMKASRNDTVFTTGSYLVQNNKLLFKEVYHLNHAAADSMLKTFQAATNGDLVLKEVLQFKNGVVNKTLY